MDAKSLFALYEKMPPQAIPSMLGGIGLSERKDLCAIQILDRILKRKIVDLQTNNGDPNEIERLKERKIIRSVEDDYIYLLDLNLISRWITVDEIIRLVQCGVKCNPIGVLYIDTRHT